MRRSGGGGFFIAQMHLFSGERKESDWAPAKQGTPVIIHQCDFTNNFK
jgi:hypothetical protein